MAPKAHPVCGFSHTLGYDDRIVTKADSRLINRFFESLRGSEQLVLACVVAHDRGVASGGIYAGPV